MGLLMGGRRGSRKRAWVLGTACRLAWEGVSQFGGKNHLSSPPEEGFRGWEPEVLQSSAWASPPVSASNDHTITRSLDNLFFISKFGPGSPSQDLITNKILSGVGRGEVATCFLRTHR